MDKNSLLNLDFRGLACNNRLAEVHNIAVVITNQVQNQPNDFFSDGNGLRPTGGNVMAHATTYRIMLRKVILSKIFIYLLSSDDDL